MKTNRKYFLIALLGFIIWVAETAAFGFNDKPANGLEAFLDIVSWMLIIYGIAGDLLTNVEIHKNYYKYKETNIKTRTVEIKGDSPIVNQTTNFGTTKEETKELLGKVAKAKPSDAN